MQRSPCSNRIPFSLSCERADGRLNLQKNRGEKRIPREMGMFLHVHCGKGDGGNGVNRKGKVSVGGCVLNTILFERVGFKIQKIANKMKIMTKTTVSIGIREIVILKR